MDARRTRLLRALDRPTRAKMKDHLSAAAGPVSIAELASTFKLGIPAATFHVRILEASGVASLEGEGEDLLVSSP